MTSTDQTVLCSVCGYSLLAACLCMGDETYDFIKNSSFCLVVCDVCKSKGVLALGQAKSGQGDSGQDHQAEVDSAFAGTEECVGLSTGRQSGQIKEEDS